jgi:hypothetical protein
MSQDEPQRVEGSFFAWRLPSVAAVENSRYHLSSFRRVTLKIRSKEKCENIQNVITQPILNLHVQQKYGHLCSKQVF